MMIRWRGLFQRDTSVFLIPLPNSGVTKSKSGRKSVTAWCTYLMIRCAEISNFKYFGAGSWIVSASERVSEEYERITAAGCATVIAAPDTCLPAHPLPPCPSLLPVCLRLVRRTLTFITRECSPAQRLQDDARIVCFPGVP